MMKSHLPVARWIRGGLPMLMVAAGFAVPQTAPAAEIDFSQDVLPILSDACFHCHGPDGSTRKADLRLDTQDGLLQWVEPGDAEASYLYERIVAEDADARMPPADSHRQLTAAEQQIIARWIKQGAPWQGHWAFQRIAKPEVPSSDSRWVRNPIDAFVLKRLQREDSELEPAPQADATTMLRRVSLDLTGLPPRPDVAAAFLTAVQDHPDQAYRQLVDSLLGSPDFGERMAAVWMEVARFSESDGYQLDQVRSQYPWRDWVIRAFNDNLPYDQFIIQQLAGDLLPDASDEQIIATGFNRNHVLNGEGGVDPNETRIEVVADRSETVATAFLGLTLSCCRCHDHKFDPLTQEDYFRFFAYFNNIDEDGRSGHNAKPFLTMEVPETHRRQVEDYQANTKHHHIQFPEGNQIRVAVLRDRAGEPRETFILDRGVWNQPTRAVTAAPPEFLSVGEDLPPNRLGLARWITADHNPLTARVAVNRIWELFFGSGIVKTQEDFGVQSARPSHPELLDWLAADFRDHGWDVKRLIKQIVMSATYRQTSRCDESLYKRDPDNRLLARGSRFRHPSWMLRDQALAVSGLLAPQRFGPSVRPYQPENIWFTPTAGKIRYQRHQGSALYRKSLYTFWRRTIAPANMFDASPRRICEVNVRRTNTPLHALVTLNDVTYVEAARVLAERLLKDQDEKPLAAPELIESAVQRVLLREPSTVERRELEAFFVESLQHYRDDPQAATELLQFGDYAASDLSADQHAALTNVCLLILNTDETLSHQ